MRIGVLTTSYPRHRRDLAGGFVAQLTRRLAQRGHTLDVLAPDPGDVLHHEPEPNVTVIPVRYARDPRLFYRAGAPDNLAAGDGRTRIQVPAYLGGLARQCRRGARRWDRILSHWLVPCSTVAALAGRGLDHLAVAHSSDVHLMARRPTVGRAALSLLAARPTRLVLTSASLRPRLAPLAVGRRARELVDRAEVIRMGIPSRMLRLDRAPGRKLRRDQGLDHRFVVLCVGRLVPVKGIDTALRACAGLDRVTVVVVGDGPLRPDLEHLAHTLPRCRVTFVGRQTGPERDAWLTAADLLVHPSRSLPDGRTESAPVTLLEAMAAGLPVLATDVGGNAELIDHRKNGLLVQPDRPDLLRREIKNLIKNKYLKETLAQRGRETAADHTWPRIVPRFEELLG